MEQPYLIVNCEVPSICLSVILTLGCVFDDEAGQTLRLSKFWVVMEDAMMYNDIGRSLFYPNIGFKKTRLAGFYFSYSQ